MNNQYMFKDETNTSESSYLERNNLSKQQALAKFESIKKGAATHFLEDRLLEAEAEAIEAFNDAKEVAKDLSNSNAAADKKILIKFQVIYTRLGMLLGDIYKAKGDYTSTKAIYNELIDFAPENIKIAMLNNLGKDLRDMGEFSEAEQLLDEGLELLMKNDPNNTNLKLTMFLNLGKVYESLGKLNESENLLLDAWKLVPEKEKKQNGIIGEKAKLISKNLAEIYSLKNLEESKLLWLMTGAENRNTIEESGLLTKNYYIINDYEFFRDQFLYLKDISFEDAIRNSLVTEGFNCVE